MSKTTKKLCLILGDQLSHDLSSLEKIDKENDIVVMAELWNETEYVKHHKKKLVLILSAMRHFKEELVNKGYSVEYHSLHDKSTLRSFTDVINLSLLKHEINSVVITFPGEYRVLEEIKTWETRFSLPINIIEDTRFISSTNAFKQWAKDRKQLRMEFFYRELRKKNAILMDGDTPIGGKWNYDADNRRPAKPGMSIPKPKQFKPDKITQQVISLVDDKFPNNFGELKPFVFAVTRKQALSILNDFICNRLRDFGDYQDAMLENEAWMFHAHIGMYLNCGLLLPMECIRLVEQAYFKEQAPLNAVEGFIRQVLGWREFVRGFYWLVMPSYKTKNNFNAKRPLPAFYWNAETKMNCLRQCVKSTKKNAYAHHIQRLMILGNFALLAGIAPNEVNNWFMIVYADAYEWVELPNVSGMALFADGGMMASKPYAAGGNYIHKMSDYCRQCHYDVKQKTGEKACPFNYLYWNFFEQHQEKLMGNNRLSMVYTTWRKMNKDRQQAIKESAEKFLHSDELK